MIGKRDTQMPLFEVGNVFDLKLDPGSFHAQLAKAAPRLFSDEDFAAFYKDKMGRPSVPPSLLALATLLAKTVVEWRARRQLAESALWNGEAA